MSIYDYYITPEEYEIARKNGIGKRTLEDRIRQWGWDKERAMTEKVTDLSEWVALAERNGITYRAFYNRIRRGWDYERATTTPMISDKETLKRMHEKKQRTFPVEYIEKAKRNGIGYRTFQSRVRRSGMSFEEAATTPLRK